MNPNDYQREALRTALPRALDRQYLALGLCGESGEVAELCKKALRDGEPADFVDRLRRELGDVLWYVAIMAHIHGLGLDEVMACNVAKLRTRQAAGALSGSGDYRGEDDEARVRARIARLEADLSEARAEAAQWAAALDALRREDAAALLSSAPPAAVLVVADGDGWALHAPNGRILRDGVAPERLDAAVRAVLGGGS